MVNKAVVTLASIPNKLSHSAQYGSSAHKPHNNNESEIYNITGLYRVNMFISILSIAELVCDCARLSTLAFTVSVDCLKIYTTKIYIFKAVYYS